MTRSPLVFSRAAPLKPTKVFDSYWSFAVERQAIFFRRLRGQSPPWTDDPILQQHKFTSAYRASDRVSQFMIRNVAYAGSQAPEEIFFRVILFKLFNRIGTWTLLADRLGEISFEGYSFAAYDRVLTSAMERNDRIYSGAYIMPTAGRVFGSRYKHRTHLRLLERLMDDEVALRLAEARTMAQAYRLIRSYPMLGDFLAYQYVIDLNYSALLNFSEMEFVVPGPGARSGIAKCFASTRGLGDGDVIRLVTEGQDRDFSERGFSFETLWGRPLQLIDCQNLFCEVDKYARLKHPDVAGSRTRIKQRFRPTSEPVLYWYPPKWKLNASVRREVTSGVEHGP